MGLVVNRENWKDWALIVGVMSFLVLGIWYLVVRNIGSGEGDTADNQASQDKKGAITSGLKDGKDYGTDYAENEEAEFEALVVLRDQQYDNPETDRRSALKRGDVLSVRKLPHIWSDTEVTSYLVVRIKMTGKEADALIAPKKDGDTVIQARAKRIDLEKVGFAGNQVSSGQPLEGKIFDTDIVKGK